MSRHRVVSSIVVFVALAVSAAGWQARVKDPELIEGIREVQKGDFAVAVITLDGVARRLAAEGGRAKELARAYVYLGIAYIGLSEEQKAKARFLEALEADRDLYLSDQEFAPRILEFFEQTRKEAGMPEATVQPPEEEGGGSKLPLVLLGAGGAAAAGVALAGGGTTSTPMATPVPTPPLDTRITETLEYEFTILQESYPISGPTFTTRAGGSIDITASLVPVPPLDFGIGLSYLAEAHDEGSGGPMATGPGPILTGHWEVGFVGEFRAYIYLANARFPLEVPASGVLVSVVFTVTHP